MFQNETGSPLAQKPIKIIFNSEKSSAYFTNSSGYITINGCDLKKSIENGIAEVSGYCDVNFDHSISHNTNGGYGYAYSTVKSSDLTLTLKKSAGMMKIQYSLVNISLGCLLAQFQILTEKSSM